MLSARVLNATIENPLKQTSTSGVSVDSKALLVYPVCNLDFYWRMTDPGVSVVWHSERCVWCDCMQPYRRTRQWPRQCLLVSYLFSQHSVHKCTRSKRNFCRTIRSGTTKTSSRGPLVSWSCDSRFLSVVASSLHQGMKWYALRLIYWPLNWVYYPMPHIKCSTCRCITLSSERRDTCRIYASAQLPFLFGRSCCRVRCTTSSQKEWATICRISWQRPIIFHSFECLGVSIEVDGSASCHSAK